MKLRIKNVLIKRIELLESVNILEESPYMLVPIILNLDAWEIISIKAQASLKTNVTDTNVCETYDYDIPFIKIL